MAFTIWCTWPLPHLLGRVQVGSLFPYDQYLSAYLLEWGRHVLWTDPGRVFDAPICYPAPQSLASTEHLIGFAPLYALIRVGVADPLTAYHVLLLVIFFLNALAMATLVRVWTHDDLAAILAGACFAFAPCQLTFGAWIHVLGVFCLPLLLLGIDATLRGSGRLGAIVLALAAAWQIALTVYGTAFGLILSVVFLTAELTIAGGVWPGRRLLLVGAAVAVTAPLLAVIARPYVLSSPLADAGYAGLGTRIIQQSAGMIPFDALGDGADLWARLGRVTGIARAPTFAVDGGRVTLLLAVVGIVAAALHGSTALRRRVAGLAALIFVGLALALGPGFVSTPIGTLPLPLVLLDELPVLGGLRFPERFIVIAAVGLAASAGIAFALLLRGRPFWQRLGVLAVLLLLVHAEARSLAVRETAPLGPMSVAAGWLRAHGEGQPVLEWPPLTTGCASIFDPAASLQGGQTSLLAQFLRSLQCFDRAARHTLENAWHWQPTTLCFTSHPPEPSTDLSYALLSALPEEIPALVEQAGIGRILVHRSEAELPGTASLEAAGFHRLLEDEREVLYVRRAQAPVRGGAHLRTGDVASGPVGPVTIAIDVPTVAIAGTDSTGTIRVAAAPPEVSAAARQRNPTAIWIGWRTENGRRVLPLDPVRAARLASLPARWREALTTAYLRDRRLGLGGALVPGEPRTLRIATTTPAIPGRYRFVVALGADEEPSAQLRVEVIPPPGTS